MTTPVVVSVTPFTATGELDLQAAESHLRRIMSEVQTVLIGGSGTEECFTLSGRERRDLVELAVTIGGELGASVRLNAREPRTHDQAREEIALAREMGCAAVHLPILDVGHGYGPRADELTRYVDATLGDVGDIDVYISTSRVMGNVFPVDVLKRLAGHSCIKGAVVAAPSDAYLFAVTEALIPAWDIYIAGTGYLLSGLARGVAGFISPEGNILPEACTDLAAAADAGDWQSMASAASALLTLTAATAPLGAAVGLKAALRHLGLLDSYPRAPRLDVDAEATRRAGELAATAIQRWREERGAGSRDGAGASLERSG